MKKQTKTDFMSYCFRKRWQTKAPKQFKHVWMDGSLLQCIWLKTNTVILDFYYA